jgi:hypothetical protein
MKTALKQAKQIVDLGVREVPENQPLKLLSKQVFSTQDLPALEGAISGHLAGIDEEGRILFKDEVTQTPYPVVIGLSLSDDEVVEAAHLERRALVIKTGGQQLQHVLVALLRERITAEAREKDFSQLKTYVSGKAIHIGANNSLELKCGRSRITLHADGRIEINGDYLLSRSRGPIKLKGATIDIN